MDDYYNEEMADEVTREDEDLFDREVVQGDDDLMLTDAFLKEVFRKKRSREKKKKGGAHPPPPPSFVVAPGGMFCKGMYVRFAEQRPEPDQCSSCTALYRPMSSTQQQPM